MKFSITLVYTFHIIVAISTLFSRFGAMRLLFLSEVEKITSRVIINCCNIQKMIPSAKSYL